MENATKALLIAAAVLVAILIISLGLVVYNMASETINSVNFSGQEVTAFNDQFTQYEGENVRGSEVNAMLKTVLSSNMKSRSEGLNSTDANAAKFVSVNVADQGRGASVGSASAITLALNATSLGGVQASTSQLYDVQVQYHPTTGFVTNILINNAN